MKKTSLIGLIVACGGVIASFATASALSVKEADNASFNITAKLTADTDGSVTYKFIDAGDTIAVEYVSTDSSIKTKGTALSPTHNQAHYSVKLGAQYGDCIAQDFVVGNIKVELTNINAALKGNASLWAGVRGYETDSVGENLYANALGSDKAIGADDTSVSVSADIAVDLTGTQHLDVYVKLTGDADAQFNTIMNLNEAKPFDIAITWGAASEAYKYAYVVGNGTVPTWQVNDNFRMVPNINKANSEGYEWYFKNLTGFSEFKFVKDGTWYGTGDGLGSNYSIDASKTYNLYWDGSSAITPQEVTA